MNLNIYHYLENGQSRRGYQAVRARYTGDKMQSLNKVYD